MAELLPGLAMLAAAGLILYGWAVACVAYRVGRGRWRRDRELVAELCRLRHRP